MPFVATKLLHRTKTPFQSIFVNTKAQRHEETVNPWSLCRQAQGRYFPLLRQGRTLSQLSRQVQSVRIDSARHNLAPTGELPHRVIASREAAKQSGIVLYCVILWIASPYGSQ
jgi:hypothetical protein